MASASVVQSQYSYVDTTSGSVSLSGVGAAKPLLLFVSTETPIETIVSVSDDASTHYTWTKKATGQPTGESLQQLVYEGVGGSGGTVEVTVAFTGATNIGLLLVELTAKPTAPITAATVETGTSGTATGSPIDASSTELMVFGVSAESPVTTWPSAPWTNFRGFTTYFGVTYAPGTGSATTPVWPVSTAPWVVIACKIVPATGSTTKAGHATLTGSGVLSASATLVLHGSATLTGSGVLSASATLVLHGSATLTGSGVLSATGAASTTKAGHATLTGSGVLSASATLVLHGSATLTGSGVLSATGAASTTKACDATLTGSGVLSASATLVLHGSATLTGSGVLSASATLVLHGSATLTGSGVLSATGAASTTKAGHATLTGSGVLSASATLVLHGSATLTGSGVLSATGAVPGSGTLTRVTTPVRYGTHAWKLEATGAGTVSVTTDSATACTPGRTYLGIVYAMAATVACPVTVAIAWKNAAGDVISTSSGSAVDDATGQWSPTSTAPLARVRAVAPSEAATKELRITFADLSTDEVHYFSCSGISDVTYAQPLAAVTPGWNVGQAKALKTAQPIKITATLGGIEKPVFAGHVQEWVPKYGTIKAETDVTAYDALALLALAPCPLSTLFATQVVDGAVLAWPLNTATGTTTARTAAGNGHTGTLAGEARFLVEGSGPGAEPFFGGTTTTTLTVQGLDDTAASCTGSLGTHPSAWTVEFLCHCGVATTLTLSALVTVGAGANKISLGIFKRGSTTYLTVTIGNGSAVHAIAITASAWSYAALTQTPDGKLFLWHNTGETDWSTSTTRTVTTTPTVKVSSTAGVDSVGYVSALAVYDTVLSETQLAAHYTVITKGAGTALSGRQIEALLMAAGVPSSAIGTIATGTVEVVAPEITKGETTLLSVIQQAENTEQGMFWCDESGLLQFVTATYVRSNARTATSHCTIADDDTDAHLHPLPGSVVPATDDLTLWNDVVVGVETTTDETDTKTSATYHAATLASQDEFGARALPGFTGMYFKEGSAAQTLATDLIKTYSQPLTRIRSVGLDSTATDGKNLVQMLTRTVLDGVTVTWSPPDGSSSPFSQIADIEQVHHHVTKEIWTTTWALFPRPAWWTE